MTRILGPERVPAGFTITTSACVAYMDAGRTEPEGLAEEVAEALARLEAAGRQDARRRRGPAARLGPLRRARVDAGDDGHGPQPRPQRPLGRGPRGEDRQPALRVGLLPPLRADVRQRRARRPGRADRGDDQDAQGRARRDARHRSRRRRAARADRPLQGALRGAHGRGVPAGAARAAAAGDPRRLRLVDGRARDPLPPHQPHPGQLGDGGQRPADGLRQQGRDIGLRRRLQPRRGDRRARALRRLPPERAGRGRRLRRPQHARHRRAGRDHAGRPRRADGDPADARAPLRRHAGHRVHGRGGAPLHAPDAQREAAGAGGRAVRRRRGERGPARPRQSAR